MAVVSIGPFLVKDGHRSLIAADLEYTGYSIELSGDEFVLRASLYRRIWHWQPQAIRLDDFYVCADDIAFRLLPVVEVQVHTSPIGRLVSLEAMLCSLYIVSGRKLAIFVTEW